MSHVCEIDVIVRDIDALKAACRVLGLEFREDQKNYKWFGRFVDAYNPSDTSYNYQVSREDYGHCEHAIGIAGRKKAYEVGVMKRKDGKGFALHYDPYDGGYGLEQVIGKNASKLRQAYAVEVAKKQARKQGFRVQEKVTQDGKVRLLCTR